MKSFPEWQHKYVATKTDYNDIEGNVIITVTAGLHYLRGNRLPYFSVTAEKRVNGLRGSCHSGGCLHEDILRYWPKLRPVVELHLSDSNGVPMHALDNAAFWLSGARNNDPNRKRYCPEQSPEECRTILRKHLRITDEELTKLVDNPSSLPHVVQQLRPRWKVEALLACELLDELRGV